MIPDWVKGLGAIAAGLTVIAGGASGVIPHPYDNYLALGALGLTAAYTFYLQAPRDPGSHDRANDPPK